MNSRLLSPWSVGNPLRRRTLKSQSLPGRRLLKGWSLGIFVFLFFALFHVWVRVQVVEVGYQIRELSTRHEELRREQHNLRLERTTLRSPVRLEAVAQQLGLRRPPQKEVMLLSARDP